jgi:hypothetical protein
MTQIVMIKADLYYYEGSEGENGTQVMRIEKLNRKEFTKKAQRA